MGAKISNKTMKNLILISVLTLFLINPVSANFVCGVVNSSTNLMPQWQSVKIYYPYNESRFTTCLVSPSENKYCCDTEDIPGKKWTVGDIVYAEILDFNSGYFAGPVKITTTGAGFDIMPNLNLEKAIIIKGIDKKIIITNKSEFFLDFLFKHPYTNWSVFLNDNLIQSCFDCKNYSLYINLSKGVNKLDIQSNYNEKVFQEHLVINYLNNFSFNRRFLCSNCKDNKLGSQQEVRVILDLILYNEYSGIDFIEYIPNDFEIIETDGDVENYSSTHKLIKWTINKSNNSFYYKIKSPKLFILPKKYNFKSYLSDYLIEDIEVIVRNFFSIFPLNNNFESPKNLGLNSYSFISKQNPAIFFPNESIIKKIVVFPKNDTFNSYISFIQKNFFINKEIRKENYLIRNNFDFEKILLEIDFNESYLNENKKIYVEDSFGEKLVNFENNNKFIIELNTSEFSLVIR